MGQGLHRHTTGGKQLADGDGRAGGVCGGPRDDYRRRCSNYWADIRLGLAAKKLSLSAAVFIFFATFCSTMSLGMFVQKKTSNRIGVSEYLLINRLGGMAHSTFGCQPQLVIRPTGPITAIMIMLSVSPTLTSSNSRSART